MEIKINIVELATKLAHNDVEVEADMFNITKGKNLDQIMYKDPNAEVLEYKEEWQESFDEKYDYYFEIINSCSINQ